jgi:hypothetical protein
LTFIEMGVEPDDRFELETRAEAAELGWAFEKVRGDMSLVERLVGAQWDAGDFLVLEPGQRVAPSYDAGVIRAE